MPPRLSTWGLSASGLSALVAACALGALAACAGERPPAAPAASGGTPSRIVLTNPPPNTAGLSDTTISACRAEAERATVLQNRGEMMRLDESENRGRDSLLQNQQERGLLVTTRDRIFRDCLARAGAQAQGAAAPPAPPARPQTATPR